MTQLYKNPLLRQCYEVMQTIEACGASTALTRAVALAGDLLHAIDKEVDRIAALEAELARVMNERDALRAHTILLAGAVLEYPDFDCDNKEEPRPLCVVAQNALDAARKPKVQSVDDLIG